MRDIVSEVGTVRSALRSGTLPVNGSNQTINGADTSLASYDGCMFVIVPGVYTDGTHTFTVQEAPDNGSGAPGAYTNVAAGDLLTWAATSATVFTPVRTGYAQPTPITNAASNVYQRVGYLGGQAWVRMIVVSTGVTTGASYEVVTVLGRPRFMPAAL